MAELVVKLELSPAFVEALSSLADAVAAACADGRSPPDLAEQVLGFFKRGQGVFRAIAFDGDGSATCGAGQLRACIEPGDALLDLLATVRAGKFDLWVKHGGAS